MPIDRDRDESEGEGPALTYGFVWVAFFGAVLPAYYIVKFATHDFAGFDGPAYIGVGAFIIGFATMVLVCFQIILAHRQISIAQRQTALAEEQTRIVKTQTEILIKQDEILNRTETLTFHVIQDGADCNIIRYQAPQEGAAAAFDIFLIVRNEGRASCNRIYVSVFIPTSSEAILGSTQFDQWTEAPIVTIPIPTGILELKKYESNISVDVFAGRGSRLSARLTLPPRIEDGFRLYWQLQSEHGIWPDPGHFGHFNVEAVTEHGVLN
jgi:hypothetical protein